MLSNLPVVRSVGARTLFLLTAIMAVATMLLTQSLGMSAASRSLTRIYVILFVKLDYLGAICALLILICAVFVPARLPFKPILRWIGEHPTVVAAATAVALCAGSLLVYQNHPLAMDEYAQFFQSQVFASGHLAARFPAPLLDWLIPEGFQNYFLFISRSTGAVASAYWPSFALLLTPFTWLGIPWVCNPLISAVTLLATHRLAVRLFEDREAAGLAVLLTVASPEFFANGISYYSMPAHLLANTLYAVLLTRPTPGRTFAAGVVGSIALTLHNPVPHMLFALPWVIWLATRPRGLRLLGSIAAGYTPLCLLLGLGWFWFTTDLRQANLIAASAASTHLESLQRLGQAFSLPDATLLIARLTGMAKVWIWAVPGLLILAGIGAWRWRHNTFCVLLLGSALATFIGFLFVPVDQGHGWGFRYFHTAWVALPLLAAGALTRAPGVEQGFRNFDDGDTRAFVVGCALLTLVFGVGFRAVQMREFIADDLAQVPTYAGTERRVEILDPNFSFYGADLVQNDPWLRGNVIRMITRGNPDDADMMREHFPDMHRVHADRYGSVWSAIPAHVTGNQH